VGEASFFTPSIVFEVAAVPAAFASVADPAVAFFDPVVEPSAVFDPPVFLTASDGAVNPVRSW
jgi:hypothetical protein